MRIKRKASAASTYAGIPFIFACIVRSILLYTKGIAFA